MATNITSATFSNTYKDDFLDSDGYHKILFNSGRTLQARELTQLQTILQRQIERFGNNIYKEGSVIKPGGVNLNPNYEFIKLNTTTNDLPGTPSSLVGTSFTGQTSGVIAKVLEVVVATGSDPATLYVQYTSTVNSPAATTSTIRMQAGENMTNGSTTLTTQTTNTVANPAVGVGTLYTIASGVYYTQGHFVFSEDQSKIISKYSDAPDLDIGFKVVEEIVTTADDTGLFDNQGATPNISAPGADRYRITLAIATKNEIQSGENFVHVATIKEGVIYSTNKDTDAFDVPNKVIAQRIFENSGNYIVKPFHIKFDEAASANDLTLQVSAGTAVVEGYRAERFFPTNINIGKALTTLTRNNEVIAADFGNYVRVAPTGGTKGLPNINVFELMNLRSAVGHGGSTIGSCRVRAVNEDGANYRYYLFDIKMNSGQAFRNVKSIGTSTTNFFNPILENNKAILKEPAVSSLLFSLPNTRPKALSDISLAAQRRFTASTNGSGQASISVSASGETFANVGDWIAAKADSDVFTGSLSVSGAGTASATVSGLPASQSNIEILAYVNKANGTVRTKTLTSRSINASMDSDGAGFAFLNLGKADIFDVQTIINSSDSNQDYTPRFTVDNGQRDNFYGLGRLVLAGGASAPGGTVHVKYRYFEHGTTGDFFAVNSYTGQIGYNSIPSHTLNNGNLIQLRNTLDFRSVHDSDGAFASASTGARINELPQPQDTVQLDVDYFLPRSGKLVITTDGVLKFIEGTSEFAPTPPMAPDQTLGLYNIFMGGNTLNDSDILIQKLEHKRFTMSDITQLEKRVDKLEEVSSLSMLEIDTKNFEVLDSAGLNRTKSGFLVDNFSTQILSDVNNKDYSAAIDPSEQQLRPAFFEDNIKLLYDSDASFGVIKKGDNVYLEHTERTYIDQDFASKAIRVNPFAVVVYEGICTLSPSSDEWRDVNRLGNKVIDGGTKLNTKQAIMWDNWSWNWGGKAIEELFVGDTSNTISQSTSTQNITNVNKVVSEETVQEVIADRVLNVAIIPFIRSRKIFFKAQGLRPNSKVFAFFDGINVASFVRSESFARYSDDTTDYGNLYANITAHPNGSSTLQTNSDGEVTGTFFIPNTANVKFRTGTREFKILDISANNDDGATSLARAAYAATGFLDTKQREVISTRVLNVEGVKTIQNKNIYYSGGSNDGGGGVTTGGTLIADHTSTGKNTWGRPWNGNPATAGWDGTTGNSNESSSGTVICTALYEMGDLPYDVWYWDGMYGKTMISEDTYQGYLTWALPISKIIRDRGIVYHGVKFIATKWANEMAARMTDGKVGEFSVAGKVITSIGVPVCNIIGKVIKGVKNGNVARI